MQNLESKYNHFIKAGVTSLPASYAEFETAMKDKTGGAQKIYDGLKNEGVELPDFNEFYSVMMPEETKVQPAANPQVKPATQSQQAVQPSTPKAGTPMTDSDKKGMMANAEVLKSNIETSVDNTAQRLNNLAKVNQPLKTDVKLGTQVSKVGDKYITTAGNDYDTPEQAKVEQFMIDESQSQRKREVDMVRARELEDDINKEKENLKKIKSTAIKTSGGFMPSDGGYLPYDPTAASESEKKIRELEQERRKVMMPMISEQLTDVNSRIETLNDEINNLKGGKAEKYSFGPSATTRVDDKVRLKNKELSLAMEERDALELMINGDDKNFFSGLIYGITRPSTYTFGLYDLAMSQDMTKAKNAYDKGALTDDQKQFMAAYERANTAKSELDQNAGSQFRFGNIAAQSAPFMLEFFGTGGMGGIQAAATSLAKRTAVALTKNMAKGMAKNLTKGLIKNTGIALGDIAAAGTMAVTTGGARTASDIINRYTGHPVQTDTGFTFKDGTTLADAVYKGLTSSTIEYYTEMLGTHMESVFPWIKSVIGKRMSQFAENVKGTKMGFAMAYGSIGLKKLGELADKSGIKAIYNDSKKAMKLFGLQSYPYEALEEEAGIVLNSMLTGDNKISDLIDGRTQEDIWGGMLYSIGMMQGITGGYSAIKYYGLKHKLSNQDVVCSNLFGDQWASIKEQIDNATNTNLLKTIFNIRTKSAEERKALLVYGGVLSQCRGFNTAVFGETEDKADNNTPGNPVTDAVNRGFTDGYNSTDEETARIENDLNDKKGLLNYDPGMSESEQFQSDVVRLQDNQEDALDYLIERYGEQHIGLATDYYNALNVYNGLTQRKADEDDDRLTHLNQQAERNEYKGQEGQSGNVITADMGGNKVYIVRGDVNTETGEMSGAIVVRDEQGKIIVTNGNALTLESVRPLEEIKQENAEIVAAERLAKEQEMKLAEEQQQEEQQIDQQQQPQDQPQDNQEQPQDNQEQQQDNQEQPQEPIEEMPMIGEGEEAEPDFYSVAPSRSRAFIYDESDLSEDEANEYVDANIEESNKKVKSLEKKKPKASTSINKYKKELDAWKQELEQAKKKADYWQQVKMEQNNIIATKQEERRLRDEAENKKAVEEELQRQQEITNKRKEQERIGANAVHPAIREKWDNSPKIDGAENELVLANGEKIKGRYVLVESGAATPSHNPMNGFTKNDGFPVDENGHTINDRDYERDKEAQDITRQTASSYDSRALQDVPVVSSDGVVLSGNGRTMAGELAARDNTDGDYIEHLQKYPEKFGFTKEQVSSMKHPRVLFVTSNEMPYNADTFSKFNAQDKKAQSRTEQSIKLGKTVDDSTFERIVQLINTFDSIADFYNNAKATAEAISELQKAGVINAMQYAEMFDSENVSGIGRQMLENMLVGKFFQKNPEAIRQLSEIQSLRQNVISALAEISNNRKLGNYSLERELAQAIDLAYQARKHGFKHGDKVSGYARQMNLFPFEMGETVADYTNATILMLANILNDKRTNKLKNTLTLYNRSASDSAIGQMDLFTGSVRTKEEIIKDILKLLDNGTKEEQESAINDAVERRKADSNEQDDAVRKSVEKNDKTSNPLGRTRNRNLSKWFGPIYTQFEGKANEAESHLRATAEGVAKGALVYPGVSPIDLVWGDMKAGYMKIVIKHPEVVGRLQEILSATTITSQSDNRIVFESDTHKMIVSRMKGSQPTDNWLLTAYEKKEKPVSASSSDIETEPEGKRNGTATPQNGASSADKVTNTPDNNQGETEKKDESKSGVKESRVVGGNSGYVGYSMSKRAAQAREDQIILEEGLGLNYSSTEGNPPKVKDGFTLYVAKDGSKIVSRSLFRDEDFKQIEAASEDASKGRAVRRKTVFSPARIRLRKLKEGETCSVERRYVENGMFDFTGKEKIESDADVAYIFRQLENAAVENCFMVLLKDGRPTVIHISMGGYSSTMAPFEQAFVAYSALKPDKVYFVHNHPSGNLKASRQDRDMLDRMKKMFGSDVVNPGIIIDTTSGKYGVFDGINIEEDMPVRQEGEVPLKVYNFSKQVFSPGWNPMESFKIKSPDDVAAFVSSHRLGEHEKMSFLVLGNDNSVVANVFLPYTKLSDIEEQGELKSATDMMAGYVHQCGGTRGIIYGNYDYTSTDGKLLSKISLRMKELGAPLLDAIHIEHSAMYEGVIGEPGVDGISLETVNKRFNNELERYQNREMASSEMLHLGNPRGVMRKFLPNIPIVMRQRILNKGAVKKHNVDVSSLSDMPQYLSSPIFVFQRNDNTLGVLTEMKDRDGKNVCVAIEINRQIQDGGDILEVNDIRSVHGRNIADIIYPIINNETLKWVDKEKGLSYLSSASRYVQQEIDKKDLISATKVVKEFKNPIIEEDKNELKDENISLTEEDANLYRQVEDEETEEWLEGQPTIKTYRSMVLIDGKLYPPMSSKAFGSKELRNPSELGKWEEAEEAPDKAKKKGDGWYYTLTKDNGKQVRDVAYNPYIHTSTTMLNDQFSEAQSRDNLVVVEMEVPASELSSGYKAEKATDSVGVKQWKAGVIQGKLSGTREVVLTRWAKPVRVVPVEEVADNIVEMIDGKIDVMPSNVVTPQQRKALEERGIKFIETDNSGKIKYGENAGKTWASVYGGKKSNKANKQETKSPQNPKFTKAQEESAVKREKQRIGNAAREMAARLGIEDDVEFIETNEDLTGREATAKGWFNRKTGKIVVVLGNHISQTDVLRTIIHEGVAHYGLRKLLGERFDTFLDEVFKSAEQEVKESILELSKKHGYNVRTATEEYLASLAEKMDFEKAKNSGWWTKIKSMFLDMMRQLGLGTYVGPALTDNELRYLLWRSYENLAEPNRYNNPFAEAKDTSKQLELKVGGYENRSGRVNTTSDREGDLLFRDGDFTERDEAIARDAYERAMMSGRVQFIEEVQDSMRSLVELYKAILGKKTRVEDIEGFENPYMFENRLSSMNMAQQHLYFIDYMKPVLKAISRICKGNDKKREELINYMMAKHGLERNLVFAERDAKQKAMEEFAKELKAAEKSVFDDPLDANAVAALDDVKIRMQQREEELFFQNREKDYGGITGLMGIENLKDAEEAARTLVDDYEWEHDLYITDLWDAVNAATQATLDKVYESGIISKESYESIRDMFQYYIPLQGWDETTSDEIYAYLIDRKQMAGAPIKHAKGRRSKADDPIATIGMRGEMAVMQANRNLMKQTFLNFVLGHPSDLVSVSELWLEHDEVNDVWIPVFVDIEEGDTGEDIKRKTEAFEQQMEALQKQDPKKYKKSSQAKNIPYKVVPGNLKAHQVIVKRNGKSYVLTINGNPKAAMALNGLTNPDVEQKGFNKIMNAATYVNRKLSIAYTTANINFTVSNFVRDMVYSNTMSWIKESPWYAINFHWNCGKYNPAMLRRLFGKWENGTLDLNNKTEKLFYDFMKNGGETGFSNIRDIDAQKKFIISELKKENSLSRKAIALLTSQLDMLNRSVENTARFAAFVTSREVGRSVERSVYDAKEVSVNFNKKGSGGRFLGEKGQTALGNVGSVIGGSGRIGYVFWNAGIQGLSNIGKNMGRHKIKGIAGLAAMYVLGRVIPMLYGDDDDNSYYDIPEKVRRSNICIKVGEQWVTISLPIEFRAIYGLGELATGVESKNDVYTDKELAYQIGSQISQILPIDFLEGDGGVKNFVPTLLRPSFEAYINESWTGLPIYKDTPWNKNMPGWTKAYKNANVQLVDFAKFVSEITGGDEYKKGAIDINPAQVEHVLSGLFGGYVIMGNQLIKMAETATGERDFDWRNMIIANRVITNGDERVKEKRTTGMYYKIKEEVEEKRRLINSYRKDEMDEKADKLETPEYENALEDLKESQKNIKQIKEMIDETSDKDIQKELSKLIRQEEKTFVERHKKILK